MNRKKPWNYKNLIGCRFGKLKVVEEVINDTKVSLWKCECDCGNITEVMSQPLNSGKTKSCGCGRRDSGENRTKRKVDKRKFNLSKRELKDQIHYNPFSGIFRWKHKRGNHKKWGYAGSYCKYSKYHTIRVNGFLYKAHILAWVYMKGYFPKDKIDHIDRNRQNNKWNNLRLVSDVCNARNMRVKSSNTSGVKGVYFDKLVCKWVAMITIAYRCKYLGRYKKKDDAVKARWEAEKKYGFTNCYTNSSAYLYLKERGGL